MKIDGVNINELFHRQLQLVDDGNDSAIGVRGSYTMGDEVRGSYEGHKVREELHQLRPPRGQPSNNTTRSNKLHNLGVALLYPATSPKHFSKHSTTSH